MSETPPRPGSGFLTVDWAPDTDNPRVEACPNCGALGEKPLVLGVSWIETRRKKPMRRALFACPACGCRYFEVLRLPAYHDWLVIGWPELHAQQGAGLWPIDSPIARIGKPPGARYLEIGCGYGFALDFAAHARGWTALGIDPSPLAEIGCGLLGTNLRSGYFPEADPDIEPWDVMVATEVIEHLAKPLDLLRQMRARLADDGVLLLTTPDGEAIRCDTPQAALAQLLAPELHMVFQTRASLAQLLGEAGFGHAIVERDATSLVAFASAAPFDLDDDMPARRRMFLDYLATRAEATAAESDLGLGFAGRAMAEATNDGDFERATAMRARLWAAIRTRYGLDLDTLDHLPPEIHHLPLQRLRFAMPFNLAAILFGEAMRRLGLGARRTEIRRELRLAAEAADVLIRVLGVLFLNDGMTEDIAWTARAELALEAAERGDPAAVQAVAALPDGGNLAVRHRQIAWRTLIELVNAGAVDAARALAAQEGLREADDGLPTHLRRDGLVVLGQLALAEGGESMDAIAAARELGAGDPVAADLLLGAFTRLVNAARYGEADALRPEAEPLAASCEDATGRDARLALAVLDLATGDPADVPARLAGLDIDPARHSALMLGAFTRLVNTSRYEAACDFATTHGIAALAMASPTGDARDARLALAVLDLATGDPAEVPVRLAGLDIDPARRDGLMLGAFTRLVNASRYDEAAAMANDAQLVSRVMARLAAMGQDAVAVDACWALAVLDLTTGDPADVPGRIAGLSLDPARRDGLMLGAFTRLVNASRYDEAMAFAATHGIAGLAMADANETTRDARLALAVLDLAAGDPAAVPDWIEGLDIAPARRRGLLLCAFTGLVNAGRYDEALALREAFPVGAWIADTADPDGADAVYAMIMLELAEGDPAKVAALLAALPELPQPARETLLLQAFLRLTNAGRHDEARELAADADIEGAAARAEAPLRADAAAALTVLDFAPGGTPARIASRLDALEQAGFDPARVKSLAIRAFVALVNQGSFTSAETLRPRIEPGFANFAKAATPEARDAGYALGVLNLQENAQPYRAEAAFAAVRRGFADVLHEGDAAPALFWEALRGEMVALHQTDRGSEVQAIARTMLTRYQGAPEDMRRDFSPDGAA